MLINSPSIAPLEANLLFRELLSLTRHLHSSEGKILSNKPDFIKNKNMNSKNNLKKGTKTKIDIIKLAYNIIDKKFCNNLSNKIYFPKNSYSITKNKNKITHKNNLLMKWINTIYLIIHIIIGYILIKSS